MVFVVDGYNVLHRVPALRAHFERGLEAARNALVRFCGEWMASRGDVHQFWVVFDGADCGAGLGGAGAVGVRVVYSHSEESADDRVVALVEEIGRYKPCTVVSDDREVVRKAHALGAQIMSAHDFHAIPRKRGRASSARGRSGNDGGDKALSEEDRRRINESLKRHWGI